MQKNEISETILAIESSCDDTAAAVWHRGRIASNVVARQLVHAQYGGIVPEVASRAHQDHIVPVVQEAIRKAGISIRDLDAVAFTRGPGLIGSLLVGMSFAKGLALALDIPLIEVNHLQAHVLSVFGQTPHPDFPYLSLVVSGGHTQIVRVRGPLDMEIIGKTRDDAAGEAFDKSGKLLGLNYPAGPAIDRLARDGQPVFDFPEPQIPGYDFSFSGIKTAIKYFLRDRTAEDPDFISKNMPDICASIQHRIVTILLHKLQRAARDYDMDQIAIVGGVSANSYLRKKATEWAQKENRRVYVPPLAYCTDNAAMIAIAAHHKFLAGDFSSHDADPIPRWNF